MDIRAAFLSATLKEEKVVLPELGGITVVIREMDAGHFDQYESLIYEAGEDGKVSANIADMSAKLVICSAFDEEGNQLFAADDIPMLTKTNGRVIKRLAERAAILSGLVSLETTKKN